MKKILILTAILAVILCGCTPREKKEEWLRANDKYYEPEYFAAEEEEADPNRAVYYIDDDAEPPVYIVEQYGLKGIADMDKNIIVEPRYERLYGFFGDYAVCSMTDYTAEPDDSMSGDDHYPTVWGVINRKGEIVVPFQMEYVEEFSDGRWNFSRDGFEGVMTLDGEIIVQPKYWDVDDFHNGYSIVIREDFTYDVNNQDIAKLYYGLIDEQGNEVLPLEYDNLQWNGNVLSANMRGEFEQYTVMAGELMPEDELKVFLDDADFGTSKICDDPELHKYGMLQEVGLVDGEGNIITEPVFAEINGFTGGYAPAAKLDYTSNPVDASGQLSYPKYFGVIDTKGNTVLDFEYARIDLSEDGRTVYVNDNILIATINDDGSVTLLPEAENWNKKKKDASGSAQDVVEDVPKSIWVMPTPTAAVPTPAATYQPWPGQPTVNPFGDLAELVSEKLCDDPEIYLYEQGGSCGLIAADGTVLTDKIYSRVLEFTGGYAVAKKYDYTREPEEVSGYLSYPEVWGVIDTQGSVVEEFDDFQELYITGEGKILRYARQDEYGREIYGYKWIGGDEITDGAEYYGAGEFIGGCAVVAEFVEDPSKGEMSFGPAGDYYYGVIDTTGEIVVPLEYEAPVSFLGGSIVLIKDDVEYIFDREKRAMVEKSGYVEKTEAEDLTRYITKQVCDDPEIHVYEFGDLCGLIDGDGNVITDAIFAGVSGFAGEYAVASKFDYTREEEGFSGAKEYARMYGVIDTAGNVVEDFVYDMDIFITGGNDILRYHQKDGYGRDIYCYKWIGGDKIAGGQHYYYGGDFKNGYAIVAEFVEDPTQEQDSSPYPPGECYYGVIDTEGKIVVPMEYEGHDVNAEESLFLLSKDGTHYIFDYDKGELVKYGDPSISIPENWSNYRLERGDPYVYAFAQGELWGLADADKNVLIPAKFEKLDRFNGDYALAGYTDYTATPTDISGVDEYPMVYGIINRSGETIVEFEYTKMLEEAGGFYVIEKDKKEGLMSAEGEIIMVPQFDDIHTFEGYFAVTGNSRGKGPESSETIYSYGLINDAGEILLPAEYDRIDIAGGKSGGVTIVATKKGVITQYMAEGRGIKRIESGVLENPQDYISTQVCDDPAIYVYEVNDLKGLVSGDGNVITEPVFSRITVFEGGYAAAAKFDYTRDPSSFSGVLEYPQMWGVIDTEGKTVEEFTYESELAVTGNGEILRYSMTDELGGLLYGYKWLKGDVFATAKYVVGGDFADGLAVVAEFEPDPTAPDNSSGPSGYYRYGIIDTSGKAVVPFEYDEWIHTEDFSIVFKRKDQEFVFDPETRTMVSNSGTVALE